MATLPQTIQGLFQAHHVRLTAIAAAPAGSGLHELLTRTSATYLSQQIQAIVKAQYQSDSAAGSTPEDKISRLATSVANLAKQVRALAPNDAYYEAFIIGSEAAAQEAFLSIFELSADS
jgi:ethanolamine utilization protein EutA (predicted chaperonin)